MRQFKSVASVSGVPVGAIIGFPFETPPDGYLPCNGAEVSRTVYADLFAVIGTTFGDGDGVTTFNLPDLRGEFIRGWDAGRGVDAGRVLGSHQMDAFQNITGTFHIREQIGGIAVSGAFQRSQETRPTCHHVNGGGYDVTVSFNASLVARTANETRPRNVALLLCIKY